MTSANGTLLGLAKQAAKGTPNITDASFTYLLFNQGGVAPNNVVVPLDEEVGGGAMLRDMKNMGVYSGGGIEFIPRPASLGISCWARWAKTPLPPTVRLLSTSSPWTPTSSRPPTAPCARLPAICGASRSRTRASGLWP